MRWQKKLTARARNGRDSTTLPTSVFFFFLGDMANRACYDSATHNLLKEKSKKADDTHSGNVQYVSFSSPAGNGFWSSYSHFDFAEHMRDLLGAICLDTLASRPFALFERFSEAPRPHLVFDVDVKGEKHPDFSEDAMVARLAELVKSAYARTVYNNTAVGYFNSMLWSASRPGKTSFHLHFFRLRMTFEEQREVARYVYAKLEEDATHQWLFNALDIEPNKRGHIRVPLASKLTDEGSLDPAARLVFHSLRDSHGKQLTRSDRVPWHGLTADETTKEQLELCLHNRGIRPDWDLDLVGRGVTRSAERNKWRLAQLRVIRASAAVASPGGGERAAPPASRIVMTDWSASSMCSSKWRQELEQKINRDAEPYSNTIRWFGERAAIVSGNFLVLKMTILDGAAPTLHWISVNSSVTNGFPKCSFLSPNGKSVVRKSFLSVFMEASAGLVDSFICGTNFIPYVRSQPPVALNSQLNTWTGWEMEEWNLAPHVQHVVDARWDPTKPLLRIMYYIFWDLCNGEKESFLGMIYYLAHIVQRPDIKTQRVLVVHGAEGTGKSTFFDDFFCKRILGRAHTVVLSRGEDVVGSFNSLLEGKIVILCEEALMNDARANDQIKYLTTAPDITINRKGRPQYQQKNNANLILLSNSSVPTYASKDARRLFVVRTTARFSTMSPEERTEYCRDRIELLEDDETVKQFAAFLSQVDLEKEWDAWRISNRFLSQSLDQMRLESFDTSLQIVVSWLLARYTAPASSMHPEIRDIGEEMVEEQEGGVKVYKCIDGSLVTEAGEDPARPGWARCVDESPFLVTALRSSGATTNKGRATPSSILALKREMTGLGFRFEVYNQLSVIIVPQYATLVENFRRVVPGMDLDKIFSPNDIRMPPRIDDDNVLLDFMTYFPVLLKEKEENLRSSRARALSYSQSQDFAMEDVVPGPSALSSSSALEPVSVPRRRRPRVLWDDDDDDDEEFIRRPRSPSPSPASSPLAVSSDPATPVRTRSPSPLAPHLHRTHRLDHEALAACLAEEKKKKKHQLDDWEAPAPLAKRVGSNSECQ